MLNKTDLSGCFEVAGKVHRDQRGSFVKTFHAEIFAQLDLNTEWREQYWSSSTARVIRGMHFQIPPRDHSKIVSCVHGEIMDVVLDLRVDSVTYGRHITRRLSAENGLSLYIPRGMAHGFLSLAAGSVVCYTVETVHDAQCDQGILWSSCGIAWEISGSEIISERDRSFPSLASFQSPFTCLPV
jgi:dTDP-4-dehydrorhamnose 3,5-epimerase